ncbi:MAG: hypothetical protein COA38_02655 [Fluviicola sp.]|nr:MAG: hypothetical protein COA38_02655 [Fluviicola sp.]
MKFGKLLLVGATAFLTFTASAQDDAKRECDRMRFLAGEGVKANDYKKATLYYHKAEIACGGFDKANWDRLLGSIKYVINEETDEGIKKLYIDSVLHAYVRQETAGFYEEGYDLERGMYIMQSSAPDAALADKFFRRGIKAAGLETHEAYVVYAYYATYLMYTAAEGDEQVALKKRMISDYFEYSEMVAKAGMTPLTQESLTTYLDYVVQSCDELLPEIEGYITNLPEDKDAAIQAIERMLGLLDAKGCNDSDEHLALVNAWLERDPNSISALLAKLDHMPGSKAIPIIDDIISKTDDPEMIAELQYKKAYLQYNAGRYKAAYGTGKSCTGKYKSDGLSIAAKCVAAMAMSCGDSTFERKCNYIYAAQLAERAGKSGAGYRAKAPTSSECFNENSPKAVTLSCWGVTVNPCP